MAKRSRLFSKKKRSSKEFKTYDALLKEIDGMENDLEKLTDEEISQKTDFFKDQLLNKGKSLSEILPEAFAVVREASKRTIGLRHYDVQMIGGIVMHEGKIAEMRTGEGKTLVATLSIYLNALLGKGVHLVTVNDYLARRDARWMAPIFSMLGLSIGVLQMANRTENGKMAFLVDLEKRSNREDEDQLRMVPRREAYQADVTYGTNNEFGFDYLRDNLVSRLEDRVQRGHHFAIVDEIDNILIDEARTPLIISGAASEDVALYQQMAQVVRQLNEDDYDFSEKDRSVALTEIGEVHVEELLNTTLRDPDRPEDITPEQARLLGHLEQALKAKLLFIRNKDYIVQNGEVVIVDEFTGRLMPGRRWSEGLHQAVEAKEGAKVKAENITQATITLQNYFRMYEKLAGMTGTALTEAEEFYEIYELEVVPIPTNLDYTAQQDNSTLEIQQKKDEEGYLYTAYAFKNDAQKEEAFWKRKDYPDVVYQSREAKLRAICTEIVRFNAIGRPQLVGTTSITHSEELSNRLKRDAIRLLMQIIILKTRWRIKFGIQDIEKAIPELNQLDEPLEKISPVLLRDLAKRGEIGSLSPENEDNLQILLPELQLKAEHLPRLTDILKSGIQHKVLNALKHDEESIIIANAGAYGAVTIATNMAGRGVDIKLGGELDEQTLSDVVLALNRNDIDPYDMTYEDMESSLGTLDPEQYEEQTESVQAFQDYMVNLRKVRKTGGLHVIGSERHEARRIDNQLRGRSARQGDPGSSRFFLSLEDDLMRLFGGDRVESMMNFFKLDKSLPIENRMIGRMVEQAQERVEGYNFDVRKHLLEYDNVLNEQRSRIYSEREQVITKKDLSADIWDMVASELQRRVPTTLAENPSPWKLCAFLDEIQPFMLQRDQDLIVPSYSYHLVAQEINKSLHDQMKTEKDILSYLQDILMHVIEEEAAYIRNTTTEFIQNTAANYEAQLTERKDTVEMFLDGLLDSGTPEMDNREIRKQIQSYAHIRLQISDADIAALLAGDRSAIPQIKQQIESSLFSIYLNRVAFTIDKRLGSQEKIDPTTFTAGDWKQVSALYLEKINTLVDQKKSTLTKEQSEINHNLQAAAKTLSQGELSEEKIARTLFEIASGKRISIDPKSHQRVMKPVRLLNYIFYAAQLIKDEKPEEIIAGILAHLKKVSLTLQYSFGQFEIMRLSQANALVGHLNPVVLNAMNPNIDLDELKDRPIHELSDEQRDDLAKVMGKQVQNMLFRHVLLQNINSLWIEHLTQMEALRVSIRMEAYAQRDPLVQYKNQGSDMFSQLLANIRLGVMSQIFRLQPVQRSVSQPASTAQAPSSAQQPVKKKKRRRRR